MNLTISLFYIDGLVGRNSHKSLRYYRNCPFKNLVRFEVCPVFYYTLESLINTKNIATTPSFIPINICIHVCNYM